MRDLLGTQPILPNLAGFQQLCKERQERFKFNDAPWVKTKDMTFRERYLSHGVSEFHYRFFARLQFLKLYASKWNISYEGLDHIPKNEAVLFVMKHRGYADISLHGMGNLWATSNVDNHLKSSHLWTNSNQLLDVISTGDICRFVMKDDLLCLPIGCHLVMNGGIPVPQDLETKARNTLNFEADDPKALAKQKELSSWFNFKDSFREIISSLKKNKSIMIYGEATRVRGDKMGHLSLKLIKKLSRGIKIIPVGSVQKENQMIIRYGATTDLDSLRESIAQLSEIPKEHFLN